MAVSLTTIWYERQRFLPAILAVAFSAVLVASQAGLVLGLLSMMSLPVDQSTADVWVGETGCRSVDLGLGDPGAVGGEGRRPAGSRSRRDVYHRVLALGTHVGPAGTTSRDDDSKHDE